MSTQPFTDPAGTSGAYPNGLSLEYLHDSGAAKFMRQPNISDGTIYESAGSINKLAPGGAKAPRCRWGTAADECHLSLGFDHPVGIHQRCYLCGVEILNPGVRGGKEDGGECEHIIPFYLLLLLVGVNNTWYVNRRDEFWVRHGDTICNLLGGADADTLRQQYVAAQEGLWGVSYRWSCYWCNKFKSDNPFVIINLSSNGFELTVPPSHLYPISGNLQDHFVAMMTNNVSSRCKGWRKMYRDQIRGQWNEERALHGAAAQLADSEENTKYYIDKRLRESIGNMQPFIAALRLKDTYYSAITLIIARGVVMAKSKVLNLGAVLGGMVDGAFLYIDGTGTTDITSPFSTLGGGGGGNWSGVGGAMTADEAAAAMLSLATPYEMPQVNETIALSNQDLQNFKGQLRWHLEQVNTEEKMSSVIAAIALFYLKNSEGRGPLRENATSMVRFATEAGWLKSNFTFNWENLKLILIDVLDYGRDLAEGEINPHLQSFSKKMIDMASNMMEGEELARTMGGWREAAVKQEAEGRFESEPEMARAIDEGTFDQADCNEIVIEYGTDQAYGTTGIQQLPFIGVAPLDLDGLQQDLLAIRERQQQSARGGFVDGYNQHGNLVAVLAKYLSVGLTPDVIGTVFKEIIGGADSVIREYIHAAHQYQQQTLGGGQVTESGAPKCQPCSTNEVYKPPKKKSLRKKNKNKKRKTNKKSKKKIIKKSPKYSKKKSFKKKSFKKSSKRNTLRKSKRKSKK